MATDRRATPSAGHEQPSAQTALPPCPFCGSRETEVMSLFGSHASLTTCWCAECRSPFEFLRWREEPGGAEHADRKRPG